MTDYCYSADDPVTHGVLLRSRDGRPVGMGYASGFSEVLWWIGECS